MSAGLPSDEIAEDYKHALEDLVTNDRFQINNLTMIAKENIEHAEAISRVLINHIKRTPPSRKLPALYVLDSLVKNIQSPYTIYLARDLHSTFMLAYSQVDPGIRRKLEETLRTWREPVPGSLSTTPVFPMQSTQSIVDALNRYRASTAQASGRQSQHPGVNSRALPQIYRNTATPEIQLPIQHGYPPLTSQATAPQYASLTGPLTPNYAQTSTPPPQRPTSRSAVNVAKLHADIDDLTTDAKIDCATHPMDSSAQRKLATLQSLKEILDAGTASEQDLREISATISQEMAKKISANTQTHIQVSAPVVQTLANQLPQYPMSSTTTAPTNIPAFLSSANLAELLRATANVQSSATQPQPFSVQFPEGATVYNTPPTISSTPASATVQAPPHIISSSALPLLEQLRASGLLPATPTPVETKTPPLNLASLLGRSPDNIVLTSASIRTPRPQMILNFLDGEKPNQCSTCGRRFTSDDPGREKKARHLDWHFKTKARMIEAENRGQNRSWYIDEREWIANKEFDDDMGLMDTNGPANGVSPSSVSKKTQEFVRAPTDPVLRNAPCPIDQEPFKSEWSEEVQDFIWKDAIRVGNRYYHASCYKEATKDRDKDGSTMPSAANMVRTATPESVLGKRKAQQEAEVNAKSRIKFEAY